MKKYCVNSRHITEIVCPVAPLIETFTQHDALLWPGSFWPRDAFEGPLALGVMGGHGDLLYRVSDYEPGVRLMFEFVAPSGYQGYHGFELIALEEGTYELRH